MRKRTIIRNNKKDKILSMVEKYVDKERELISKDISQKKEKRKDDNLGTEDIEVMISRLKIIDKKNSRRKQKNTAKIILYIVYLIIILLFIYILFVYIIKDRPH